MKLNYKRTILVGFAFFLISAFWQAYDAIVPMILENHYGLDEFWSGVVMSLDNVLAVFMLPLFGALSDKTQTKYGKRKPFVFIGAIAAVVVFIGLTAVDMVQLNSLRDEGIVEEYQPLKEEKLELDDELKAAKASKDQELIQEKKAELEVVSEKREALINTVFARVTSKNIGRLALFIVVLLLVLIAMATFRSPAVALMPDVTVKPLRSKGNAIINLMGAAGGILVLGLGILFGTSKDLYMNYFEYIASVCGIMVAGLIIFALTVKENKWAKEMEDDTKKYGIENVSSNDSAQGKRKLSRDEFRSLILILASVALWYIGYNSVTSKYSVYATGILGFDYNTTLIVAQAAAIVSYIPVGIVASKLGRRKTILAGVAILGSAFLIGNFITPATPQIVMYPVFALAGIGWATINVNSFPMVVELAKGGDVGKYTGYYYTASMAAQICAPILSGLLYKTIGMRETFFAFATVFVALSFVTMFFVKHGDAKAEKVGALEALAGGDDD